MEEFESLVLKIKLALKMWNSHLLEKDKSPFSFRPMGYIIAYSVLIRPAVKYL